MTSIDPLEAITEEEEQQKKKELGNNLLGYIGGTGLEIGAGYGTDILTSSMLLGGPIGWAGYAATNFASGAASNWAAQKLRGEEDISWGEIISSGLIDIIPFFGQKLKGAKGVANVALQSGARTAAQRQGEEAIDDQRWLTHRETLEAATIGGVFGTAVAKGLPKGYSALRSRYGKYDLDDAIQRFPGEAVQEMIKQGRIRETPREATLMLTERLNNSINGRDIPDQPARQRMIYATGGMRGGYYNHYDYVNQGWMSDDTARYTLETFQTRNRQFVPGYFEREKRRLLPGFLDEYGDYLRTKGVTQDQLDRMLTDRQVSLHHIVPIKGGAALYHDTYHGDKAWTAVTDIFEKHGLFPGIGKPSPIESLNESNFIMALKEPHDLVHNQFLYEILGRDGSRFFTPERLALIESGLEGRKFVAEEYALIVKQSKVIIEDAMKQMQAMFSNSGIPPEELAELMARATDTGELKILNSDLILRSVNEQLKSIADEVNRSAATEPLGKEVPEVIQDELDKYIRQFFQRIQQLYKRGGKGGLDKPPVNPYD